MAYFPADVRESCLGGRHFYMCVCLNFSDRYSGIVEVKSSTISGAPVVSVSTIGGQQSVFGMQAYGTS